MWGGAAFGGIVAVAAAGRQLHDWGFNFIYLLAMACAVGALIGFVFFELVIARLVAGPAGSGASGFGAVSGSDGGGSDGGGGDGDGGGK